jgi:hypothetical protein
LSATRWIGEDRHRSITVPDPATVTAVLAQALPYLMAPGGEPASRAARRLGEHTWNLATRMWEPLADAVLGHPAAERVVERVAANPQDAGGREALAYLVRRLVQADPDLGDQLERLIEQAQRGGVRPSQPARVPERARLGSR